MGEKYGKEGIQTYLIQNPHHIEIVYFEDMIVQEEIEKMLKEKGKTSPIKFSSLEIMIFSS